jgi:hypothetical protein
MSALKCYTLVTLDTTVLDPGHEEELRCYIEKLRPSVVVVGNQDDVKSVEPFICKDKGPFMGFNL